METRIINLYPKSNRRYTCEFTVSVFSIAGEYRPVYSTKDFKSPLTAEKHINQLMADGSHILNINAAQSFKELNEMSELWRQENAKR
jgi:hypothetical protein